MRVVWQRATELWRSEARLLTAVLALAGLLLAFGHLAAEVSEGDSFAFDRQVMLALRAPGDVSRPIGPPWMLEVARDITALGSHMVLAIVLYAVVGYLLLTRRYAAATLVLVSVLGGMALSALLKLGIDRPRPELVPHAVRVFSQSFPSGHAVLSAVTYLTLGAMLCRTHRARRLRVHFMTIAITVTFLVGLSRIYLGVHYPTDVLAGWCIGAAWALASWLIARRAAELSPGDRESG
jgi:undecaprenyl-diphosphatase